MLKYIAMRYPEAIVINIENIPYYGRWDDLFTLIGSPCEDRMWNLIERQWKQDLDDMPQGKPISLMAKWLKSCNTSSAESRKIANKTAKRLGLSQKEYRKKLSALRKHINVVEKKMSANDWKGIDFSIVPSRASMIYRNAFRKHEPVRYESFISSVEKGEAKINAATLYPYDIFEKMRFGVTWNDEFVFANYDRALEAQWKALPDYVGDGANFLVIADTSGSMQGRPMCTSVGLAMYFAERNHGPFKNLFMTFSSKPSYVEVKGDTLYDKIKHVPAIVSNTGLKAAFELVLNTALAGHVAQEDMPKALVVISDSEIDEFYNPYAIRFRGYNFDFISTVKAEFAAHGYELPNLVLWNVDSRHDCYLATTKHSGVQLASGQSPSVFKSLIANMGKSAYQAMVDTLNDPMYDRVVDR